MEDKQKMMWSAITIIVLVLCGTGIYMTNKLSLRKVNATNACNTIFLSKEKSYFSEITKNRYIYNDSLNTCLMLSQYTDASNGDIRFVVIDLVTDTPLFPYLLKAGKDTDESFHMTKDEALARIRSYGFFIF